MSDIIEQKFEIRLQVDHTESKQKEFEFGLPWDYQVTSYDQEITSINGTSGIKLIEIIPGRPNFIKVIAFAKGRGVVRRFGVTVDRRGRGWIEANIRVYGKLKK